MIEFTEGNLKISFPRSMKAERFDDPKTHGLTHCMKAVDFIVEKANFTLFIELKDPDHPQAKEKNMKAFIKKFSSGSLDEELKYKYRDTFLYRWAQGNHRMPVRPSGIRLMQPQSELRRAISSATLPHYRKARDCESLRDLLNSWREPMFRYPHTAPDGRKLTATRGSGQHPR